MDQLVCCDFASKPLFSWVVPSNFCRKLAFGLIRARSVVLIGHFCVPTNPPPQNLENPTSETQHQATTHSKTTPLQRSQDSTEPPDPSAISCQLSTPARHTTQANPQATTRTSVKPVASEHSKLKAVNKQKHLKGFAWWVFATKPQKWPAPVCRTTLARLSVGPIECSGALGEFGFRFLGCVFWGEGMCLSLESRPILRI